MNNLLSVLIPSRNERFLSNTVDDIFKNAAGEVEIIVVYDGYWHNPPLEDRDNLVIIHRGRVHGMRSAINSAALLAKGNYLMKTDAHCSFAPGFDKALKTDCDDNWIVIPSRYSLQAEIFRCADGHYSPKRDGVCEVCGKPIEAELIWDIDRENRKPRRDYHYLCYPDPFKDGDKAMHGVEWWERCSQRSAPEYDIDDEMSFQGSCWFTTRKHFFDFLGTMDEVIYGKFKQEAQELGLKTWLGGGRVVVNKKTWYAHLHKGSKYGRGYSLKGLDFEKHEVISTEYWMLNKWKERKHDLEWFIDKFSPVPTWGDDWREKFTFWRKHYGFES